MSGFDLKTPEKWGLANLGMFFEGEDMEPGQPPFAASVMVMLRTDAPKGASVTSIRARDLAAAHNSLTGLEVIAEGPLKVDDGAPVEHVEWIFADPTVVTMHQIVAYVMHGQKMYTITGTHRHDKFENVREDILEIIGSIRGTTKKGKKS
jgi:hypothetical protein